MKNADLTALMHMHKLGEIVHKLTAAGEEQKTALVQNDIERIEELRRAQETLLDELGAAQAELLQSLVTLARQHDLSEDAGPEEVYAHLPAGSPVALKAADLDAGFRRLKEVTMTNHLLAFRALAFYRKLGTYLRPEKERVQTYGESGRLSAGETPVISHVV